MIANVAMDRISRDAVLGSDGVERTASDTRGFDQDAVLVIADNAATLTVSFRAVMSGFRVGARVEAPGARQPQPLHGYLGHLFQSSQRQQFVRRAGAVLADLTSPLFCDRLQTDGALDVSLFPRRHVAGTAESVGIFGD